MRKFLFFVFFVPLLLYSQVNNNEVKRIIENFLIERNSAEIKEIIITDTFYIPENNPVFTVFNMYPKGFIIIANSYKSIPIIGYSFESSYKRDKINSSFNYWLSKRIKEINYINKLDISEHPFWKEYLNQSKRTIKTITPLLYSKWDQGKYYNTYCPADPEGPDGHAVTGCVATAMGQIMYFHRWPENGSGAYSYEHPVYGTISADFENAFYDFNEMMPFLDEYNHNVALLLHHIGVSVDMVYGPFGSGMWNHKAAYAFKTHFKYHSNTRYIFRDSTTLNWDSLIISNLEQKKPLYYAGWEDTTFTSGHAFVCDGYQEPGYYHFNWGWGGYLDGYFYIDNLNPAGYNFNYCQELIVDIFPDTLNYIYPQYCGDVQISYSHGTISSNNGNKQYLPNSICEWKLNPECGTRINLQFLKFNLANGDSLLIFDGENNTSNLLSVFHENNVPVLYGNSAATNIKSTANKMLIVFNSDDSIEDEGFVAFYKMQYCNVDTFTENSDTITDGSGECDYKNYTNCRWVISPTGAQALKIKFIEFNLDTLSLGDYVQIYKNSISTSNLVATFNYQNVPSDDIYIPAGKAVVRFITNSSGTAEGWKFVYENITSIMDNIVTSITITPNPIDYSSVVKNYKIGDILVLYDVTGREILKIKLETENFNIGGLLMNLKSGFYYCKIRDNLLKIIKL